MTERGKKEFIVEYKSLPKEPKRKLKALSSIPFKDLKVGRKNGIVYLHNYTNA